jgi:hypothetical protein
LEKSFDPLERQRIEAEIGFLKKKIFALQLEEFKFSLPVIETMVRFGEEKPSIDEFDWKKAGRA